MTVSEQLAQEAATARAEGREAAAEILERAVALVRREWPHAVVFRPGQRAGEQLALPGTGKRRGR
jgi:hypothetical protein